MEQIRTHAQASIPSLFDQDYNEEPPLKIGTEVFDCTMPSELEFQEDETHQPQRKVSKGEFSIFEVKAEEGKEGDGPVPSEQPSQSGKDATAIKESQYQMLTRSIVTFTFHKGASLTIYGQPEYALHSYIPHFLNIKTFPVRFRDEADELNRGASALRLFWKSVVGYVKVEVFISAGTFYLLERRKEGFLVKAGWSIAHLFKLFSDREQQKARLIFRTTENGETKLITRELQEVDLNMLATLLAEAGTSLEINSA